jgi:hypothetical protein
MGVGTHRLRLVQDAEPSGPERSDVPPTVLFEEIRGRLHQSLPPQAAEATSTVLRSLLERGTMVVAVFVSPGGAAFRVLEDEDAEPMPPTTPPDASVHP